MTEPTEVEASGLLADPAQTTEQHAERLDRALWLWAEEKWRREQLLAQREQWWENVAKQRHGVESERDALSLLLRGMARKLVAYRKWMSGDDVPVVHRLRREAEERQARIDRAVRLIDRWAGGDPHVFAVLKVALAGDQPPAEEPKRSEATRMVTEFHRAFDVAVAEPPSAPLKLLRAALIGEEAQEASTSLVDGSSLEAIAKELADVVYVVHGTAVSLGLDLDEAVRRVHASNMSKRNPDGSVSTRPDGKILKPATYRAPDLSGVALRDVEADAAGDLP